MNLHQPHCSIIDAIGSGRHYTREIAQATGISLTTLWWRLCELRRAGVIQAIDGAPCGRGRPAKQYKLNVWSEQP